MRRSLALAVALLVCALVGASAASAASSDLLFSEYVEGSGNNKALEIFNDTGAPVDLAAGGYNVQIFFNGSATAGLTINLTGTVANGDVFVLAQSAADPAILALADQTNGSGWFNGDDAVVLRKGTTMLDVIGQIGFDPGAEWGTGDTSTADNTLRRKPTITAGDPNGADAFGPAAEWDGFPTNTFGGLGAHNGVVVACPPSLSMLQGTAGTAAVSASDPNGTVTSLTLGPISPVPASGSISLSGVTPAGAVGGTASGTLSVSANVPAGSYSVEVDAANDDATPQTGSCTTIVNVQQVLRVSDVQGAVTDLVDGPTFRSPLAPESGNGTSSTTYFVRGVITQKTLARTSAGASQNGFFLQDTLARSDNDPNTSDGVFVFMGGFSSLIGGYVPRIGDEVIIQSRVSEFFDMTELSSASLEQLVNPMLDVDVVAPAFDASPPDDLEAAGRYWERREGMRGRVPAGALVTGGRDVFASTADSEVWLVRGDSAVAQRSNPYARRAFRDAHPLDNQPGLVDDGNGYRILLGPLGVKATAGDNLALLPPARVFDSLGTAVVGGVDFSFDKYRINPAQEPVLTPGVDPSLNAPPAAFDRSGAYSIANFNVENLYDYRDDPFDGCDFTGNAGCPGVAPPFDYVPESQAAYDEHLGTLASEVANDLHGPDILLVQEAEDQDICTVDAGALQCGTTNNADGKPDTLQELALRIAALGGPAYDAAFDRNGADDRGIVAAFLYRTDRVQLLPVAAGDPVLGSTPGVTYRSAALAYNADVSNPKALNADLPGDVDTSTGVDGSNVFTRAPQVGHFRVWRNGVGLGAWVDLYAVSNHFSSGPDTRVGQRTEQANYLAAIVAALQAADPQARVDAGGDLNVFPRPDDPLVPASDQLAGLYDLGLENLFDTLVAQVPASAYTYVFEGQAQTLDHQFVTPRLGDELEQARVAHLNADWPADFAGDGPRGASDHDPLVARYDLPASLPQLRALLDYYVEQGLVDAKTAGQLRDHLDQAAAKLAQGNAGAYRSQLQAFIDQTRDKTPKSVDPVASAQLVAEARLLLAASSSAPRDPVELGAVYAHAVKPAPHATSRVDVTRLPGREVESDRLAVEEPLEIRIDGEAVAVTMRTPGDDEELALGFCLTEGLRPLAARLPDDLAANTVEVVAPDADLALIRRSFYTSSSCGVCGKGALEAVAVDAPRVESELTVPFAVMTSLPDRLREAQATFALTGSLHATGLFAADGELLCLREDVGRHNAMDKVVGWAFGRSLLPLRGSVLCVSGRLSFELVQKAAVAGCPVLAAVGAPSSLAVELADDRGVTLCGFVRGGRANLYTHPSRILR